MLAAKAPVPEHPITTTLIGSFILSYSISILRIFHMAILMPKQKEIFQDTSIFLHFNKLAQTIIKPLIFCNLLTDCNNATICESYLNFFIRMRTSLAGK
jgi:hypothetical protein